MCYKGEFIRSVIVPFQQRRLVVFFLWVCLPLITVAGQDIFSDDTITIRAVTVTAPLSMRHIPFSVTGVDSSAVSFFHFDGLGALLESATPFSIRQNGNSGLTSVAIRGMSGSHIQILWNGISVTGSNTGMSDLALIPVMVSSSVLVTAGGADLEEISGSIGGKIELRSEPYQRTGSEVSLETMAGSNDEYASMVTLKTKQEKVSANLSIWGKKAGNDFLFINNDDPRGAVQQRRSNAASSNAGIMHDFFLTGTESSLSIHFWYNLAARELPGPVTTVQQNFGETQDDRSLRGAVRYKTTAGKLTTEMTAGVTDDVNSYNNEAAEIRGDNRTTAFTLRTGVRYRLHDNLELGINFGDEYQAARSLSYDSRKERNLLSTTLTAVFNPGKRVRLTTQAREIVQSTGFITPEFTVGGSYLLSDDGRSVIKGNLSRNIKLPTMNDLYWNPGGTAGLSPEISTGTELGYSFKSVNTTGVRNAFDLTLHAAGIHDLIQWVPGEYGYWSASNIRDVKVRGLETRLTRVMPVRIGRMTAGVNYSITSSAVASSDMLNDRTVGKQLMYTPLHHLSASVSASFAILNGGLRLVADSRRFTTADNSEWLTPSCRLDAELGAVIPVNRTMIKIGGTASNLLNTPWESVRSYPMPLRTYRIKLILTFSSTAKTMNQ